MNDKASQEGLLNKDFNFFEETILNIRDKYKTHPMFKSWYAAVGDNYEGEKQENFICIGMNDSNDKITLSRIRIPKNKVGKRVIEKFIKSYLYEGIESQHVEINYGENLNTVGYIETKDNKYLEVYTMLDELEINNTSIKLNLLDKEVEEDNSPTVFDGNAFDKIESNISSANELLDSLEAINKKNNEPL